MGTYTKEETAFIQNKIAEGNKEIKHDLSEDTTPVERYFEVIKKDLGIPQAGNAVGLELGTIFKSSAYLLSSFNGVTAWLIPSHLPQSGLNTIAIDICQELTEDDYNLKLKAQEQRT